MAGSKTLDPTTCTTAAEAFKYPLPQVRQFRRSLTAELDEKNGRLRTLVGGSYRQLLGTAETILQMRDDIGLVEDKLDRVGKGCGRGVVEGMARGLGKLPSKLSDGIVGEEMGRLAKSKVLDMCSIIVGRLLRRGAPRNAEHAEGGRGRNLVLAAKVLVLSRLLSKSLSDSTADQSKREADAVETTRRKLGSLRKRLLRAIKKTLEMIGGDDGREDLLQTLCAYSLATSSGAKHVLRHFLDVRGESMALAFDDDENSKQASSGVLSALEQYTRTLRDVQALVPRRLSEALAGLKARPLLKDKTIRELEGLRLDIYERRFGDQISIFIPYIRHDDLEGSQAVETLRAWAKRASEILLQGFSSTLKRTVDFKAVVELRTRILQLWIKDGGKARGFDPSTILNGFRGVINDHMVELLESRAGKLHLVGTEIEATLGAWGSGLTDQHDSLWSGDIAEMDINNGANLFKQGVLARTHGRNDTISRAVKGYQTWRHLVDEIINVIAQLKKQRWDDDLEDIEDDISIESRNVSLSKEDPQMLQDHLDSSLEEAYKKLHDKLCTILETYQDSANIRGISIYILRILRDIRSELPKNPSVQAFGLQLVPPLHEKLAVTVSEDAIGHFVNALKKKRLVGRGLWEGDPQLPIQPSPKIYKFLRNLAAAMGTVGPDLWSPAAVTVLKRYLRATLSKSSSDVLKPIDKIEAKNELNGRKPGEEVINGDSNAAEEQENGVLASSQETKIEPQKEILIQSLFDIFVLQSCLELSNEADDGLQTIVKSVESWVELDASSRRRLQHSAKEYWKRSSLLFGLLA